MGLIFKRRKEPFDGGGLVLFETTREAMRAIKVLRGAGFVIKLVAPPVSKRKGCDLAVEFNSIEELAIERELGRHGIQPVGFDLMEEDAPRPIDIVKTTELGDFVMVKAANMKIAFNRRTGRIENISGGGCPDVPYLYDRLVGANILEATPPRTLGHTLCALMLDAAFERALEIAREG